MKRLALLLALTAAPVSAADCNSIESAADRLSCYDAESGREPSREREIGNWTVLEQSSPNGLTPLATVEVTAPIQCGSVQGPAFLTIDCGADFPQMFVTVPCRAASMRNEVYTHFQFETHGYEVPLLPSPDGKNFGSWANDIQGIRGLLSSDTLTLSFIGSDVTLTDAQFDLSGGIDLMRYLVDKQCIWMPKAG